MGLLNYKNNVTSGERKFLEEILTHSARPLVIDIGANEGAYSAAILEVNPDAQVFAFEPHPATFQRLSARAPAIGNVTPINAACGSASGKAALFDYAGSQGSSHASLHAGVIETIHKGKADQHLVEIFDLDSFAADRGISFIDLLKIDTEGNDLEVLKGATRLLRENRVKAIQFEFSAMNVISRVFLKDFCDLLPGYRFYRLLRDGIAPIDPYSPMYCELFVFQNIVALPAAEN